MKKVTGQLTIMYKMNCVSKSFVVLLLLLAGASCIGFIQTFRLVRIRTVLRSSVGIDLGTTYSLVSVIKDEKPHLIKVENSFLLPSVVRYTSTGTVSVGSSALSAYQNDTDNTFHSVKRLIGRTLEDAVKTKDDKVFGRKKLTSQSISDPLDENGTSKRNACALYVPSLGKSLLPEEISAEVLKALLSAASRSLNGNRIENAVITVPAYFDAYQRAATEKAGYLAGLKKVKLLKEPEAAAMAYGLLKDEPRLVFVIDLGGGTFDVSVLEVGAGLVEVIATSGDGHLGGDDFDQVLVNWVLEDSKYFSEEDTMKLKNNKKFMRKLTEASTEAKIRLTSNSRTTITLFHPLLGKNMEIPITRSKFHALVQPLLARMLRPIREVAILAGVNLPGESGLIGSTSVVTTDEPVEMNITGIMDKNYLRDVAAKQKSGRETARQRNKVAGTVSKEIKRLQRSASDTSLIAFPGGQALDDVILVGGASRMPCVVQLVQTLTGIDPKRSINPDEAICLGAGVLSGVLDGTIQGLQVVSPLQAAILRFLSEKNSGIVNKRESLEESSPPTSIARKSKASLPPELFKTDVNSQTYQSRGSTTKMRFVTEDDEDVVAFLQSQGQLSKMSSDEENKSAETPRSSSASGVLKPARRRSIFQSKRQK